MTLEPPRANLRPSQPPHTSDATHKPLTDTSV
jgi:hypothetical protein